MNGNNKSVFLQKILIAVSILLFLHTSLTAQSIWKPEDIHFGFKLNPTFGYVHLYNNSVYKSDGLKLGFSVAGTADYLFTRNLGLAAELAFSTINGGTVKASSFIELQPSGPALTVQQLNKEYYKISYLELPVAVKFRTNIIGEASLIYFKFGIDPALKLSAGTQATSSTNGIPSILGRTSDGSDIRSFRASYLAGIGYDYRFSHYLTFTSGLLFNNGFTPLRLGGGTSMTNSFMAIEFGVYF